MNKFLVLASLTLAACTGGKDSADTGAESTATATATATATETATGSDTGTGTGTGTADVVTSCNVPSINICFEFVNAANVETECAAFATAYSMTATYAAEGCPTDGRLAGSCSVPASDDSDFSSELTAYYYTGATDTAAMCAGAGGTYSASR
ncbi:MAG: hypothetical protein RLZZ299_416 [Pseudomonadota bacterium]|jgi:hypothetical protein